MQIKYRLNCENRHLRLNHNNILLNNHQNNYNENNRNLVLVFTITFFSMITVDKPISQEFFKSE